MMISDGDFMILTLHYKTALDLLSFPRFSPAVLSANRRPIKQAEVVRIIQTH